MRVTRGKVEDATVLLNPGTADISVCSPPYYERDGAGESLAKALGSALAHVRRPRSRGFVVMGQVKEDWSRPFDFQRWILEGGAGVLLPAQTQFWVKSIAVPSDQPVRGHCTPITHRADQANDGVEFVLHFTHGQPARPLDRLAVGVPFADKGNLSRGSRGANGDRRCAGTAHFVPYATTGASEKKAHRHAYPEALVERLLRFGNPNPGGTVFDPFWGGGTTGDVARRMGFEAMGLAWDQR
jgi:hypothetical protein